MQNYNGSKTSPLWQYLWSEGTMVDYRLKDCKTWVERERILQTCDMCEICLRNLASHVHFHRTGDAVSAAHMLAIKAPGSLVDVAPSWLVADATSHSKVEHQRDRWVRGEQEGKK